MLCCVHWQLWQFPHRHSVSSVQLTHSPPVNTVQPVLSPYPLAAAGSNEVHLSRGLVAAALFVSGVVPYMQCHTQRLSAQGHVHICVVVGTCGACLSAERLAARVCFGFVFL